jgi:hypothetical protein
MSSNKFFGLYRGICMDNADPIEKNRIRVQVPQVLGQEVSDWAWPCLPITSNADHPDHLPHLAAEVAALLTTHTTHASHSVAVSGTTGSATVSTFGSHTHSFSATQTLAHDAHAAHAGNGGELTHGHEDSEDPLEVNGTEHTPHRKVPNLEQGVWIMFEGGDPNFPVWIGVF